jgi:hypothetical protein
VSADSLELSDAGRGGEQMEVDAAMRNVANSSSSSRQQVLGHPRARHWSAEHWSAFEALPPRSRIRAENEVGEGGGVVPGANAAAGERGPGGGGERGRERERELHKHGLIAIISLVEP